MIGLPPGVSSGYLRIGGNIHDKVYGGLPVVPHYAPIQERASPAAPLDMEPSPQKAQMSRDTATGMGYTGDACDVCGSMRMVHSGTCNTCQDCASTTGCS